MKSKRLKQVGRDLAGEEIQRLWGDTPVIDSRQDLRVFIVPQDVATAVRQDPTCCVFARACRRSLGCTKILIWRTVAYLDLPQADGSMAVERFILSKGMRELIENFDAGHGVVPKAGFLLKKVPVGRRLDRRARNERARKASERRRELKNRAKIAGTRIDTKYADKPLTIDATARCGSGAVHFAKRGDNARDEASG